MIDVFTDEIEVQIKRGISNLYWFRDNLIKSWLRSGVEKKLCDRLFLRYREDMVLKIGILAYGSLIYDPGDEIHSLEVKRISCETPFKVEYARISSSRGNAPTLMKVNENSAGKRVNSIIIILRNKVTLEYAKSILWRRECRIPDQTKTYSFPQNPSSKHVLIGDYENYMGINHVIYTYFIPQDRASELTPSRLADFAIKSFYTKARVKEQDGIHYLLQNKKFGIVTELSDEYEKEILKRTNTKCLSEAIEKLDEDRIKKNNTANG